MPALDPGSLVGRTSELAELAGFLDIVWDGLAGLLVEGPAGIGKTALLDAGLDHARARGFRVLVSRPAQPDVSLSLAGLVDLFEDVPSEAWDQIPAPQRSALDAALLRTTSTEAPTDQLALSLGARGVLQALSRSSPVIVAVDDLQWLDGSSVQVLSYAMRRLRTAPVAFIGSLRSEEGSGLVSSLTRGFPDARFRRLDVPGLLEADLIRMIRDRLDTNLPRSILLKIHGSSAGNPLHALELTMAVLRSDEPSDPGRPLPVPTGLRELIQDRLSMLDPDVRDLLFVASYASDPDPALLQRLGWSSPRLGPLLASAEVAGVLETAHGRLRFVHPLLATVLRSDRSADEIRATHRRLAEAVSDLEERARHLALGAEGPDEDVAATLEEVAGSVRRRGAPTDAGELFEHAARLTPTERRDDGRRRTIAAAECYLDAGDAPRSRELLEGLVADLPHGTVRAVVLQRLGWARYHDDSWTAAAELFEQARNEAGGDPGLEISVTLDESLARLLSGNVAEAAEHARAAVDQAERDGQPSALAEASAVAGSIDFMLGKGVPGDLMDRAVEMETWRRTRPTLKQPSVAMGILLKWSDDYERAHSLLERARQRMVEQGNERSLPFVLFHLAELECWTGDWQLAQAHAEDGDRIALDFGQPPGRSFCLYAKALVHALRGHTDAARNEADEGLALSERSGAVPASTLLRGVLGFIDLSLGDLDRASQHLGMLAEAVLATGIFEPGVLRYLGDAIETLVATGDLEPAASLTQALASRSGELGRPWGSGVAARCDGLIASVRGDGGRAVRSLEDSVRYLESVRLPFELARSFLALGNVLRRDRKRRAAREALQRSLGGFESLGAPLWAERARQELSRISGRAPAPLELTPTEERVARLVAGGAKNQEVADELFITLKTVEWHLSQIYRKLGVRSRTELARWMATQEPPASP